MSVIIRPIQQSDRAAWDELWSQYNTFYKRTVSKEVTNKTFSRFLDSSTRMYAAVAEYETVPEKTDIPAAGTTSIIGFVHWYPHVSTSSIEEQVYLHDLFVDPNVRNQGTGRKLIEHVYDWAKDNGAGSVYWHTQYFNHRAQLLYTKVAERTDFVKYQKTL